LSRRPAAEFEPDGAAAREITRLLADLKPSKHESRNAGKPPPVALTTAAPTCEATRRPRSAAERYCPSVAAGKAGVAVAWLEPEAIKQLSMMDTGACAQPVSETFVRPSWESHRAAGGIGRWTMITGAVGQTFALDPPSEPDLEQREGARRQGSGASGDDNHHSSRVLQHQPVAFIYDRQSRR
jgi:hypothetical protein